MCLCRRHTCIDPSEVGFRAPSLKLLCVPHGLGTCVCRLFSIECQRCSYLLTFSSSGRDLGSFIWWCNWVQIQIDSVNINRFICSGLHCQMLRTKVAFTNAFDFIFFYKCSPDKLTGTCKSAQLIQKQSFHRYFVNAEIFFFYCIALKTAVAAEANSLIYNMSLSLPDDLYCSL